MHLRIIYVFMNISHTSRYFTNSLPAVSVNKPLPLGLKLAFCTEMNSISSSAILKTKLELSEKLMRKSQDDGIVQQLWIIDFYHLSS